MKCCLVFVIKGGADKWQNANSAVKMLLSVSRFPTHTDVQTEHGSRTLSVLRQSLTVLRARYMLAHVACVQVRLHVPFNGKMMIQRLSK